MVAAAGGYFLSTPIRPSIDLLIFVDFSRRHSHAFSSCLHVGDILVLPEEPWDYRQRSVPILLCASFHCAFSHSAVVSDYHVSLLPFPIILALQFTLLRSFSRCFVVGRRWLKFRRLSSSRPLCPLLFALCSSCRCYINCICGWSSRFVDCFAIFVFVDIFASCFYIPYRLHEQYFRTHNTTIAKPAQWT